MKHHDALRPIARCKGCCLNQKTRCAAGLHPKERWAHGRCKHYDDKALLAEILRRPEPSGAKQARLVRQAKAVANATQPHYNGSVDPEKMAIQARRIKTSASGGGR
jgi:hypothetical protein